MDVIQLKVSSAAQGEQIVRFSQPFEDGFLPDGTTAAVYCGTQRIPASFRILTRYPKSQCVRAGIITFLYDFCQEEVELEIKQVPEESTLPLVAQVDVNTQEICVSYQGASLPTIRMTGPEISGDPEVSMIEHNAHCLWVSYKFEDEVFSHIIDVRVFADGTVSLMRLFMRKNGMDGFSPAFGWEIDGVDAPDEKCIFADADGTIYTGIGQKIYFPLAHDQRAGAVTVKNGTLNYTRVYDTEQVPLQSYAYRRAAMVIAPKDSVRLNNILQFPIHVEGNEERFNNLLSEFSPLVTTPKGSELRKVEEIIRKMMLATCIQSGPDLGDVTCLDIENMKATQNGFNRMNHMAWFLHHGFCKADDEMIHAALLWADNVHDLSVWWGPGDTGGTRYPNCVLWGFISWDQPPYHNSNYMWRSNGNQPMPPFCHKGFSHFFTTYELTGDPYLLNALKVQTDYALEFIHVEKGLLRNVGVIRDFSLLYEWTGEEKYRNKMLEMYEEYKQFINEDGLYSEQGGYVDGNECFINDDPTGYKNPFAKPYILGYGIEGLSAIYRVLGPVPGIKKAIMDLARFIARTLDECGTRRYPHPQSARTDLFLEHGQHFVWILERMDDISEEDKNLLLDAIEAMLRSSVICAREVGFIGGIITSWEVATGRCELEDLPKIYEKPKDRDRDRDLLEGEYKVNDLYIEIYAPFLELLSCYSRYRSLDKLTSKPDGQFAQYEQRLKEFACKKTLLDYETPGVLRGSWIEKYPAFIHQLKKDMKFPLARRNQMDKTFEEWKKTAQEKILDSYLNFAPTKDFNPMVIDQEDRGSYVAQKIVFNVSAYSRVAAYLLTPKGYGPFPAMLVLHDHGAKFDIGKEKMVRPFGVSAEVADSAQKWVEECYDGTYVADELASRGYVCLCVDALNWSDRSVDREYLYSLPDVSEHGNQSYILDSNMQHLGASHAGWIAHEDLAAAEFLASMRIVDAKRIGAIGLSMGALRTWQVAAMSPYISAGAVICWLSQVRWLIGDGVNHAGGNETFMLHSGLYGKLDIPDFASVACPKPMLYFNGLQDVLFPVPSVRGAYSILRDVYKENGAGDKLVTKLWDAPHVFNKEMQAEVFPWLDQQLKG